MAADYRCQVPGCFRKTTAYFRHAIFSPQFIATLPFSLHSTVPPRARNERTQTGNDEDEMEAMKPAVDVRDATIDFVELVAKAMLSGIGVAIAMAVAILVLTGGTMPA